MVPSNSYFEHLKAFSLEIVTLTGYCDVFERGAFKLRANLYQIHKQNVKCGDIVKHKHLSISEPPALN